MKYKFPKIEVLDDVLPHIVGRDEFIVAEREFGTVVNYVVSMQNTFDMTGTDDLGGAIRRECRGIIFDLEGKIMSRPFHKFFNANEREETNMFNVDLSQDHVIMEKLDGSMIRPIWLDGKLRLATKMGITDVAVQAEKCMTDVQYEWMYTCLAAGKTPLFEYVGPENKIVLEYSESKLILTALRDNITGEYEKLDENFPEDMAKVYGKVSGSLEEYIARARKQEGREGDIIRFATGHMLKIKNDWYVRIHKVKDKIRTERHILDLIINENLDDILPILDEGDQNTILDYEKRFDHGLETVLDRLYGLILIAKTVYGGDKKRVALEFVPNLLHKQDARFIFKSLDEEIDLRKMVIDHVKTSTSNTAKYEALEKWMGL